jgi:GNAT superfamily N-acetyltransferase
VELRLEDEPDPADLDRLEAAVMDELVAASPHPPPRPLTVTARDGGRMVGGCSGWTWDGCGELVSLWVEPAARGEGLGRRLLEAAEAEAGRRGCRRLVLFTHASQGAGRYPAMGWELVGRVEDFPTGDAALWFTKVLPAGGAA